MKYQITHTTRYHYGEVIPVCHNAVRLTPREGPGSIAKNSGCRSIPRQPPVISDCDYFGNEIQYFSIQEAHDSLTVTTNSRVFVASNLHHGELLSPSWESIAQALPHDRSVEGLSAYQFAFDSVHVRRNPLLAGYARQSFSPGRPILESAVDLTRRIYEEFQYDPWATTVHTSPEEAFQQRRGVCQDFAHVQIGCLRSIGLAARYVSGYLRTLPPPGQPRLIGVDASHAWLSLYCGEMGWIDLDPTNNTIPSLDHITLSYGRDYSDVCPIKGVFTGGGQHAMAVSVDVAPVTG